MCKLGLIKSVFKTASRKKISALIEGTRVRKDGAGRLSKNKGRSYKKE